MQRVLNQAANAATKASGTIVRRRVSPARTSARSCAGHQCHHAPAVSIDLKDPARTRAYEERGPAVSAEAKKVRARKMIRELRNLGYRVDLISPNGSAAIENLSEFRIQISDSRQFENHLKADRCHCKHAQLNSSNQRQIAGGQERQVYSVARYD
jgi:hypothetical protein